MKAFATWHPQPPVGFLRDLNPRSWQPGGSSARLRLVTWNVWGLPFVTPHRRERIRNIAKMVAATTPDIVCFQEVFLEKDRRLLCESLADVGLSYYRSFSSVPCGSGLLTLSRFPIVESAFLRFSQGGDPLALQHGDWWAGKGAGLITVEVPDFGPVRVINTHLHARYNSERYSAVRQSQVRELAAFVETAGSGGYPVFLLGDLNHNRDGPFWAGVLKRHPWQELSRPWSPLDYIILVKNDRFTSRSSAGRSLHGKLPDGTRLSDHRGLVADVRLLSGRP